MDNRIGVNVFGLLSGRIVVAHDEERHLMVTWNESLTFQVWSEDGGWFREEEGGWTAQGVPSLEDAKASAREHLVGSRQGEEDDEYPEADWRYEVANEDTRLGYEDWVEHKREADMPRDNFEAWRSQYRQ